MKYSFQKLLKERYLHVRITGDNTGATIRRYLKDILAACATEKCLYVLIEENLEGPPLSITEIYTIIAEKVGEVREALRAIAFVDVHPRRESSNVEFGETVSRNRAMTVSAFATVAEAEKWLREVISKSDA